MFNPSLDYVGTKTIVKVNGDCSKQDKITFDHGKIVNIYNVYEIERSVNISSYPKLGNCLFGAFKLTKHFDVDLYKYCGYNRKEFFSVGDEVGRNVVNFGVDMSSSSYILIRKKIF